VSVVKPAGAFYILPSIKALGKSPGEMTQYLIEAAQIAVVPGNAFGEWGEGYIRISYANSYENLEIAMDRMAKAIRKL
jgi:aspartate/methionine/tyrosine aminotransferase